MAKEKVNNAGVAAEMSRIMNGPGILDVFTQVAGLCFSGFNDAQV